MRSSVLLVLALVGCNGCDGERTQRPQPPRPPEPIVKSETGIAVEPPVETQEIPKTLDFLDAPPGTLDGFFTGLVAAENKDPGGRVLMLLFGDSHTAGDS